MIEAMIRICALAEAGDLLARTAEMSAAVEASVEAIVRDVALRGDVAVEEYTRTFDGRAPRAGLAAVGVPAVGGPAGAHADGLPTYEVPRADWAAQAARVASATPAVAEAMRLAAARIERFHALQATPHTPSVTRLDAEGITLALHTVPLARVGLYVPGGTARYPSSVLMTAIPARLAGVRDIIMVTPGASPETLFAAELAGVTRVFELGGAQAVAALAYGTASVPRVDKIVGPGNAWVAAAKRRVFGLVDIDSVAGPTEVLIVADADAAPAWVAADMLAQAEHDALAQAIAVVPTRAFAEQVAAALATQLGALPRKDIAAASLRDRGALVVAPSVDDAIAFANAYAAEHLSLHLEPVAARAAAARITNAGAVFVGAHACESAGDYLAGSNHVLPTGGSARFASGLGVVDFQKRMTHVEYTAHAAARDAAAIHALAEVEGLHAHGRAALLRAK